MRILLVEDEEGIASFIVKGLRAEGHMVVRAASVHEAQTRLDADGHDLVILDLLLPDGHGRDVLAHMRKAGLVVPVLVLSALGEIEDKVDLLDSGANDYLTKPFAFAELAARVRALTREERPRSDVIEAAGITLDTRARSVTRLDREIHLTSREFALLEYLMRHAGQVLSRQQLLQAVWGLSHFTTSNVVDVYVRYLRRKLDRPGLPPSIETVRGAGYRVPRA